MEAPLFQNVEDYFSKLDVYSKVVKSNYMYHREMYGLLKTYIDEKFAKKEFKLLDLGSGNAFFMSHVLAGSLVTSYTAYDLSRESLEEARSNLTNINCEKSFLIKDLSKEFLVSPLLEKYDLIWSSYALHHLSLESKKCFFKRCFDLLENESSFILVDIFNDIGTREDWFNFYRAGVDKNWTSLSSQEKDFVCNHVYNFDYPESLNTMGEISKETGFAQQKNLFKEDLYFCMEFKK